MSRKNKSIAFVLGLALVACASEFDGDPGKGDAKAGTDAARLDVSYDEVGDTGDTNPDGGVVGADASGDAPIADVVTVDTAPETAPPPSCTAALCEDFESATLDARWAVTNDGGGAFEVQTAIVARGKRAAHFHLDQSGDAIYLKLAAVPKAIQSHLFGRMFFYAAPDVHQGHSRFFNAGPVSGPHLEIGSYIDGWQVTSFDSKGEYPAGGGKVPTTKFACVQFELDGASNAVKVTAVDGKTSDGTTTSQPLPAKVPTFSEITLGFYHVAALDHPMDVYFDELVLDTKAVACP